MFCRRMLEHEGARVALAALAAVMAAALVLAALSGCTSAKVDDASPRVSDVVLSATSDMTESSQRITVKLVFDQPITATESVADDFRFRLNGEEVDASSIALTVSASGEGITFTLAPAEGAQGLGRGAYFAVYQAGFEVYSARSDGALPSITGASGSCAVLDQAVEGVLPSGLSIEVVDQRAGSAIDGVLASTTFRVTSPATVRSITWFSPDGGQTKLLKHNHRFTEEDAASAAADLADVVNKASSLGLVASAVGDEVTVTATSVVDGQVIEPCIVEGLGVTGGEYDESMAPDGAASGASDTSGTASAAASSASGGA